MSYYDMNDYTGQKFGMLTILKREPHTRNRWICKCDCGKEVSKAPYQFKHKEKSCGCLCKANRDNIGDRQRIHGLCKSRIYHTYQTMVARCYKPKTKCYKHYGGRGITVCDEWLGENGFINFKDWAFANGYTEELTIDRIDVNGNYEPDNCRWATKFEQAQNKTTSVYIDDNGSKITVKRFNRIHGITTQMFTYNRLKDGKSAEEILYEWNIMHSNDYMTEVQAAEYYGVHRTTISDFCISNKLQHLKFGTRVYIPKGQIIKIQAHKKRKQTIQSQEQTTQDNLNLAEHY